MTDRHQRMIFDQQAKRYRTQHNAPYLAGRVGFLLRRLLGAQGTLLDVGTGIGVLTQTLERRCPALHVQGVDYSPEMIAHRVYRDGRVGDAEALPFPAQTFDWIVCSDVIEHVETPTHVFREAWRCLKPGGRLLLTTPNPCYVPLLNLAGKLGLSLSCEKLLSLASLRATAWGVGFHTVQESDVNPAWAVLSAMLGRTPGMDDERPAPSVYSLGYLTRCFDLQRCA